MYFSDLYQWTLQLDVYSALKEAIDSVLCAFCSVKPSLFLQLLQKVSNLVQNLTGSSMTDDRKESEAQTDDTKSMDWYCKLSMLDPKQVRLTEGQLLTVAAAARSPSAICQLIESGLPALLTYSIMGWYLFC